MLSLVIVVVLGLLCTAVVTRRGRRYLIRMIGLFRYKVRGWFRCKIRGWFRCKIRARDEPSTLWPCLRTRWPRLRMRARWIDDTLLVRHGPLLVRKASLPATVCRSGVYSVHFPDLKRCGRRPIAIELALADGSRVEIAAPESARVALVGPYLTAGINDLPPAPVPRRQLPGPGS